MRLAAVDIGSNTVHALVADVVRGKLEDVAHYVEMPELGSRVAKTGEIGPAAAAAIRALRRVVNQARSHDFDLLIDRCHVQSCIDVCVLIMLDNFENPRAAMRLRCRARI